MGFGGGRCLQGGQGCEVMQHCEMSFCPWREFCSHHTSPEGPFLDSIWASPADSCVGLLSNSCVGLSPELGGVAVVRPAVFLHQILLLSRCKTQAMSETL